MYAAYAICDLEDREFGRTRWGIARQGDEVVAVALEYSGMTPQPVFLMGAPDGLDAILRDVVRPRAAYLAALPELLSTVEHFYRVDPGPPMVRMWVDKATFRPYPATVAGRPSLADRPPGGPVPRPRPGRGRGRT